MIIFDVFRHKINVVYATASTREAHQHTSNRGTTQERARRASKYKRSRAAAQTRHAHDLKPHSLGQDTFQAGGGSGGKNLQPRCIYEYIIQICIYIYISIYISIYILMRADLSRLYTMYRSFKTLQIYY